MRLSGEPTAQRTGPGDNFAALSPVCATMRRMTPELPEALSELPLDDPETQSDVVDLLLSVEDRRSGALALLVCDSAHRPVQPVVVADIPEEAEPQRLVALLDLLFPMLAEDEGSVLFARGRRRGPSPTDLDRSWHQAVIDAARRHGVRLLGFHVATPAGVVALPEALGAAS